MGDFLVFRMVYGIKCSKKQEKKNCPAKKIRNKKRGEINTFMKIKKTK